MSERRGCFPFPLPLSGGKQARLPGGLPVLERGRLHRTDLKAVERAQRAAEGAQAALVQGDVPDAILADLVQELAQLLTAVHAIGTRLAEARAFLVRNDPDVLARERADVELQRLDAGAAEILELRRTSAALDERAALADRVRRDLTTLEARLQSSGQELEALRARVEARAAADDLVHEVRAYHQSATLALDAYEATRKELR